jgi:hypothetical protein
VKGRALLIGAVMLATVACVAVWLRQRGAEKPASLQPAASSPAQLAPMPTASASSGPAGAKYPIVPAAAASAEAGLDETLLSLFGRKVVLDLLLTDHFAHRVVATVDNLGRAYAPAQAWPLRPATGRFLVSQAGDSEFIDADNGLRYSPYVVLIEQVDLRALVAAYVRLYPLFQQAYEELGFPHGYFNDRLVEVIDLMLATPDVGNDVQVHLPAIHGPVQPARPWVLYEFDDMALESLPAGQKVMVRIGAINERRVKSRLKELRTLLAGRPPSP